MKKIRIWLVLLTITLLIGCTNLDSVGKYAKESKDIKGYTEATENFVHSFDRYRNYVREVGGGVEDANRRREMLYSLLALEAKVEDYMEVLGALTGNGDYRLVEDTEDLKKRLKEYPEYGLDSEKVEAVVDLSQTLVNTATYYKRKKAVNMLVVEGNEDLQIVLGGMGEILELYRLDLEIERESILDNIEEYIEDGGKVRVMSDGTFRVLEEDVSKSLAIDEYLRKDRMYKEMFLKIDNCIKQVEEIARGHQVLYVNVDKISKDDVKDEVDVIKDSIKDLKDAYEEIM